MESYFFKKEGVILARTGDPWEGKGDCLWRTAHFAMIKNSYSMLFTVGDLLFRQRRWPEALDDPSGIEHRKKQGFGSMTRDPYVMFYAAAKQMNRVQLIEITPIPWYCWRPGIATWRKYLITGSDKHERRYEFWHSLELMTLKWMPAYARYLSCWMGWVADSEKIMARIRPYVPLWNLMQRQLTRHPLRHLDHTFIECYLPRERYLWGMQYRDQDLKFLNGLDKYQLDREALHYVWNENKRRDEIQKK